MKMGRDGMWILLSVVLVLGTFRVCNCKAQGLVDNFYSSSCPQAEDIVRNVTRNRVQSESALAAKLLRMHFHDCFVRGCDGSVLLDKVGDTLAEKDAIPNLSLAGFDVIDEIKTQLEQVCPGVVSCADILALAARDAVTFPLEKPRWGVLTGRKDGNISLDSEANQNLPSPFADFPTLLQSFTSKGLDLKDLVILSGGHTLGVARCPTFSNRVHNFNGVSGDSDPSLDQTYAGFLQTQCPHSFDPTAVELDPGSSLTFDNNYFNALLENKGLLQSDAALLQNPESFRLVKQFNVSNVLFQVKFAFSMKKMGAIDALTGDAGQIRQNCRVINP